MATSDPLYDSVREFVRQQLSSGTATNERPDEVIRSFAGNLGLAPEMTDRLVADLARPEEPRVPQMRGVAADSAPLGSSSLGNGQEKSEDPFILIDLGQNQRPGAHLTAMFHVFWPGYAGKAHVSTQISSALKQPDWKQRPSLHREAPGYWSFHNSFFLRHQHENDHAYGEYFIEVTCRFPDVSSNTCECWRATLRFEVVGADSDSSQLEIVADGQGLINLHGLNLTDYARVRMELRGNSLVNMQSFQDQLEKQAKALPSAGTRKSVKPIRMKPLPDGIESDEGAAPLPVGTPAARARLDLPGGRRLLLLAQETAVFGRSRTGVSSNTPGTAATDVTLAFLPRTAERDRCTRGISRNHLAVRVGYRQLELRDPREAAPAADCPAFVDGTPLAKTFTRLLPSPPLHYATRFYGTPDPSQSGGAELQLEFHTLAQDGPAWTAQTTLQHLHHTQLPSPTQRWLRDRTGVDVVRVERTNNPDELNGVEAYLLVMGIVLIGSDEDCAVRLTGSGVRPHHAALAHWGGAFWCLPIGDAPVRLDGRPLKPQSAAPLATSSSLQVGESRIAVGEFEQCHLPPT